MRQSQHSIIYEALKQEIQEGVYPKGGLLPTESELSARFQTTRTTVRHALSELANRGYIDRRQGKGSIVKSERQTLGLLSFRGFSDVVKQANHSVRTRLLNPQVLVKQPGLSFIPPEALSARKDFILLHRLRFADEYPVMLEYTYLPARHLGSLIDEELIDSSLFKTLRVRFGVEMVNLEQNIRAVAASPDQAEALQCAAGAPLLYVERKYITNRQGLFIYSELFCYTEFYAISNVF